MKYKYRITTKEIFSRPLTSTADTKEEIEAATGMTIDALTWSIVCLLYTSDAADE